MAMYTTSLEVIVNNLCKDRFDTIDNRIESARKQIFSFDYPVPDKVWTEDFKTYFETAFINEYLFDEIASETVARFKQRLHSRLLRVMPKYAALFTMLDKIDYSAFMTNNDYQESDKFTAEQKAKAAGTSGSKSAGSNLPENMLAKGTIGNATNVGYASSGAVSKSASETENEAKSTNEGTKKITGRNSSQLSFINEVNPEFFDLFNKLINEFSDLFTILFY